MAFPAGRGHTRGLGRRWGDTTVPWLVGTSTTSQRMTLAHGDRVSVPKAACADQGSAQKSCPVTEHRDLHLARMLKPGTIAGPHRSQHSRQKLRAVTLSRESSRACRS